MLLNLLYFHLKTLQLEALYNNLVEEGQLYKVKFNTEGLPAGIYFTVVHATNERIVRKMVLVR